MGAATRVAEVRRSAPEPAGQFPPLVVPVFAALRSEPLQPCRPSFTAARPGIVRVIPAKPLHLVRGMGDTGDNRPAACRAFRARRPMEEGMKTLEANLDATLSGFRTDMAGFRRAWPN